jgi:hypothetical protein
LPLHRHGDENVFLLRWAPDTVYPAHSHDGGEEGAILRGAGCATPTAVGTSRTRWRRVHCFT